MAITTVKKAKIGVEDINRDMAGTGAQSQTPTSQGAFRTSTHINSSHVPTTTATRAKTDAAGTTLTEVDVDTTLQQLLDDNAAQGIPDDSTIEVATGVMRVKDGGIVAAKLAANSVDSDAYVDGSIDNEHLNPTSTSAAVAGSAASGGKVNVIQAASIDTADIAADAITTAKIVDDAVTLDKLNDGQQKRVYCLTVEPGATDITDQMFFITPTEGGSVSKVGFAVQAYGDATGTLDVTVKKGNTTTLATQQYATTTPAANAFTTVAISSAGISGNDPLTFSVALGGTRNITRMVLFIEYTILDA